MVSDNLQIQAIKRAQDLPNVDEFSKQCEWHSVRCRMLLLTDPARNDSIPSSKDIISAFKFKIHGEKGEALRKYLTTVDLKALAYACMLATGRDEVPGFRLSNLGGFNAIFRASFGDGADLIIRVPLVHTPGVMASTVATMSYVHYFLIVPCPAVLAWNDQPDNPVGLPYLIMEAAEGISLYDHFETPDDAEQTRICVDLNYHYTHLLEEQPFEEYGRLVFNNKHLEASLRDLSSYCISSLLYNKPTRANGTYVAHNLEPSKDIRTMWTEAWDATKKQLIERWGKNVKNSNDTIQEDDWMVRAAIRSGVGNAEPPWGLVEDTTANLLHIIENMPIPPELSKPCLVWPDYAFRNIMYDESTGKITAFLDWDDTAILPAILIPHLPEDVDKNVMPPDKIIEEYSNKDVQKNIEQSLLGAYPQTFDKPLNYYRSLDEESRLREFYAKSSHVVMAKDDVNAMHVRAWMATALAELGPPARDHFQEPGSKDAPRADRLECKDAMRVHCLLLQQGFSEWIAQSEWLRKKAIGSTPPRLQLYSTRKNWGVGLSAPVAFLLGSLLSIVTVLQIKVLNK